MLRSACVRPLAESAAMAEEDVAAPVARSIPARTRPASSVKDWRVLSDWSMPKTPVKSPPAMPSCA